MGITGIHAKETDSQSFVKSWSEADGFLVMTINKAGIRFVRLLAKVTNPKDDTSFLSKVSHIQMLLLDEGYEKNVRPFKEAFGGFCDAAKYEPAMKVEDADGQKEIFCKIENDCITGMIILNESNGSLQMVCLNGRFEPEDIEPALSGKEMKGIGVNMK
jgi:hypothetical protein